MAFEQNAIPLMTIEAGLPLVRALRTLERQAKGNPALRKVIGKPIQAEGRNDDAAHAAVGAYGSRDANIAVIKKLEGRKMGAVDRMQAYDAWMDAVTHQCQQTIYMASYNDAPAEKDDIFRILSQIDPKEVVDKDAAAACKLESYDATPSYEV